MASWLLHNAKVTWNIQIWLRQWSDLARLEWSIPATTIASWLFPTLGWEAS